MATGDLEVDLFRSRGDLDLFFLEGVLPYLILKGFCLTASVLANEALLGDLDLFFLWISVILIEGIDEMIKLLEVFTY